MPVSAPAGSGGVSIAALPILDFSGQATGLRVPLPNCSSAHISRPGAAAGFNPIPRAMVTTASLTLELAIAVPDASNGTLTSTSGPLGESTRSVPGSTEVVGSNGTLSQPVGLTPGGRAASKKDEPSGKVGLGFSFESARSRVE